MTIVVDDREKRSGNITSLKRRRCDVKVEHLDVGDYIVGDTVIERKEGSDFIQSIRDKRIWSQAKNLKQADYPIIAVIDENIWKTIYFTRSNWMHKSYFGALTKLTTSYGITVLMFPSDDDFLRYVKRLEKQQGKKKSGTRPAPLTRKPTSLKVRMENNLCTAKGISVKTAKKILKHFGSVKKVANASVKQLTKIDGIGNSKAKSVNRLYNEKYSDE